jgi:hypothetical protein
MKKFESITSISQGKFTRNRTIILNAIKSFENSDVILTLEKPKKKRSNNQNSFYWGVLIPLMQSGAKDLWGEVWSIDKAHKHLSNKFVFHESINEKTGEVSNTPKSTTELTTTGWEVFMTEIRIYLLEDFDINAPEPNENITLNFN